MPVDPGHGISTVITTTLNCVLHSSHTRTHSSSHSGSHSGAHTLFQVAELITLAAKNSVKQVAPGTGSDGASTPANK